MNARTRRLRKEMNDFDSKPNDAYSVNQTSEESAVILSIEGPEDTPYEGGVFLVILIIPSDYPFKPPRATFMTKIYHPSVFESGGICCCGSFLENDSWSPALTLSRIAGYLYQILKVPDENCHMNSDVSLEYLNDRETFLAKAHEFTLKYAI